MATILFILSTIISLGGNPFAEECQIYPLTTEVIYIDYEDNTVTCVDNNDNMWVFEECEDWYEGDIAVLIMYNNMTKVIYDDVILTARYEGYVE